MEGSWDVQWTVLEAEWHDIVAREHAAAATQIPAWEEDIEQLVAEQTALMNDGRWVGGPDDLLSIIGCSRRETYHSAILAWLLNPYGRHGLGTVLLAKLLQRLDADTELGDLTGARP